MHNLADVNIKKKEKWKILLLVESATMHHGTKGNEQCSAKILPAECPSEIHPLELAVGGGGKLLQGNAAITDTSSKQSLISRYQ
jgi:hypothetical protein